MLGHMTNQIRRDRLNHTMSDATRRAVVARLTIAELLGRFHLSRGAYRREITQRSIMIHAP